MKKQFITSANLAYQDVGQGFPLLMGHSFLWDSHMWAPQIAHFQKNYRCLVPELWSHGSSDPLPAASYTLEKLAQEYWQFTQQLNVTRFALIGLSVGGMWATQLALSHPEAISALVLMDTFVGEEPPTTQKAYFELLDAIENTQSFTLPLINKIAPYFFGKETALTQPQLVETFKQSLLATPQAHIKGKVALGRMIFDRPCLLDRLAELQIPTLIVVGEEDLPRPAHEAQAMLKRIPHAQLALIPKAGHICTLEQPAFVNEVVTCFLKQHLDNASNPCSQNIEASTTY